MSFSRSTFLVNTRIVNLRSATSRTHKTRTGEFKSRTGVFIDHAQDVRLSVVQRIDPITMQVGEYDFILRMYIEQADDTIACDIDITSALSDANIKGIVQAIDASDIYSLMQHMSGCLFLGGLREVTHLDDEVECCDVFIKCAEQWRKQVRKIEMDGCIGDSEVGENRMAD